MKRKTGIPVLSLLVVLLLSFPSVSLADFTFTDDRFVGDFSTENLDRIIEAYGLYDGWYWTTPVDVPQTFCADPDHPGWTASTEQGGSTRFKAGWAGCRWAIDKVSGLSPGRGGYGECFGFAQFIGYLLSGDINPHHHWRSFRSLKDSKGLKVGDIVRVDYLHNGTPCRHSAIVYSVSGEEILFMYASGGWYNQLSIAVGFSDGNFRDLRYLDEIGDLPTLTVIRSEMNFDPKE